MEKLAFTMNDLAKLPTTEVVKLNLEKKMITVPKADVVSFLKLVKQNMYC
jgi:hypothetical protein